MKRTSMCLVILILLAAPGAFADDAALYKGKCAMCHGPDGKGDTPMGRKLGLKPFSAPEILNQTDDQLSQTILTGKGKMPPFDKKLTPAEVKTLVAFVRTLGTK